MKTSRRDFIQQAGMIWASAELMPLSSLLPSTNLPGELNYATPEHMGVTSQSIINYLQEANTSGLEHHGFMMARHGKVIAEAYWKPFAADHIHTLYSLSKSFTSTAVGLAVQEGRLKLTDKVISFFPEHLPVVVSDNLAAMEVRHALHMATGHIKDTMGVMRENNPISWVKTFLAQPVEKAPGTHFLYNTGSTYVCGAIVSKLTGQPIQDYLQTRLYQPLGIKNSDWEMSPEGYNTAGYGLRISTRDIIRFGQLYLNKGKINTKQVLSEAWVDEATTSHIASTPTGGDWGEGYGYQFWRCRHNFYRGDGAFGQYCIVMPQHGIVIALNSESSNMQKQMDLMWTHLLPGIKSKKLKPFDMAYNTLQNVSSNLSLPARLGTSGASILAGGKKIILDENQWGWQSVKITDGVFTLEKPGQSLELLFGWNSWKSNDKRIMNPFGGDVRSLVPSTVHATAGMDENTFKLRLKYTEAMHGDLISIIPKEDKTEIRLLNSLAEKNPNNKDNRKPLTGTMA